MGRIHSSTARTFDATEELILATTPDDDATITLTTADLGAGYAYDHGFGDPTNAAEVPIGAPSLFDLHFEYRENGGGVAGGTLAISMSNDPDMLVGVFDVVVLGLAQATKSKAVPYEPGATYSIPLTNALDDDVFRYIALSPSAADLRFRASIRKRHA